MLFHPKKSSRVTIQKSLTADLHTQSCSYFGQAHFCNCCFAASATGGWMSERKPSLLSRAPTLQELSHSRQAVNMSQDTCRSLQPTSRLGTERLLSSSSKDSPRTSYSISWNIHAPKVFLNSPGIPKYLGYFCMIQSMARLTPHTCQASCGMQGHHCR